MKSLLLDSILLSKRMIYAVLSSTLYRKGISKTINGARLRFPLAYGRYYPSDYEPFKQKFIEDHAQGIAVDLGAHIGLYTVLLSRKASQVIAFEPTAFTRQVLGQTLRLNDCNNVTIRPEMVTDKSDRTIFYETKERVSNANSVVPLGSPVSVDSVSLDDLNINIDFLKVDIEGAELFALQGATRTLKHLRYMTLEIHPRLLAQLGQRVPEIFDLLAPYNPVYYLEGKLASVESLCNISQLFEVNIFLNGANS